MAKSTLFKISAKTFNSECYNLKGKGHFLGAKAPLGLASVTTHMLTPKSFNMQYLAYFFSPLLDIIYKLPGGCLEDVWRMTGGCLEGFLESVCKVSGGCL